MLKKEERDDVSYPLIVLERMRSCFSIESGGVSDTFDSKKEVQRMSRRKKAKVPSFLKHFYNRIVHTRYKVKTEYQRILHRSPVLDFVHVCHLCTFITNIKNCSSISSVYYIN